MKRKYEENYIIYDDLHDYFKNQTNENLDNLISTHLKHINIKIKY